MKAEVKGNLVFKHVDPLMARFGMEVTQGPNILRTKRVVEFDPVDFPGDFDLGKYEVAGTFSFSYEVKEKPKPKK